MAGFGSSGDFRPWEGYLHTVERSLCVHPGAQVLGTGTVLLGALVARANCLGQHVMLAGIKAGNVASLALHRPAGIKEAGRLHQMGRKFDRWLDLVFMQRLLATEPGVA